MLTYMPGDWQGNPISRHDMTQAVVGFASGAAGCLRLIDAENGEYYGETGHLRVCPKVDIFWWGD